MRKREREKESVSERERKRLECMLERQRENVCAFVSKGGGEKCVGEKTK